MSKNITYVTYTRVWVSDAGVDRRIWHDNYKILGCADTVLILVWLRGYGKIILKKCHS